LFSAKTAPVPGTVILAREQSQGRGQFGTSWVAEAGQNILASIIFYPGFLSARRLFSLNIAVATGLYRVLKEEVPQDLSIKWPNDLYYKDLKLGGILLENTLSGSQVDRCIAGFGININQKTFPDSLPNPTSLALICGREFPIQHVLKRFTSSLHRSMDELRRDDAVLYRDYLGSLYGKGDWRDWRDQKGRFEAKIKTIDDDGCLLLKERSGRRRRYAFKEVEYIMPGVSSEDVH
jgi:BirA family biotin operon repressor/biotin-[acetyl-CoA-carboxylase] ligase